MLISISKEKPVSRLSEEDTAILQALTKWMFSPSSKSDHGRNVGIEAMTSVYVPDKYRKSPSTLYRALVLKPSLEKALREKLMYSKSPDDVILTLDPVELSSYTTSIDFANEFAKHFLWTQRGSQLTIIFKKEITPDQVILNLPDFSKSLNLIEEDLATVTGVGKTKAESFYRWITKEEEVIIKNTKDTLVIRKSDIVSFGDNHGTVESFTASIDPKRMTDFFADYYKKVKNLSPNFTVSFDKKALDNKVKGSRGKNIGTIFEIKLSYDANLYGKTKVAYSIHCYRHSNDLNNLTVSIEEHGIKKKGWSGYKTYHTANYSLDDVTAVETELKHYMKLIEPAI